VLKIASSGRGEAKSSIWQWGIVGHRSYGTVRLAKSKILVQMSISLFSKSYGKSLEKIF
jgi:hypothetical protein